MRFRGKKVRDSFPLSPKYLGRRYLGIRISRPEDAIWDIKKADTCRKAVGIAAGYYAWLLSVGTRRDGVRLQIGIRHLDNLSF